ncbi:MAG TPA: cyanophycin synthetase [Clostridia bacterium]|nr:cyanophycin synthetase [Clostridia bacterium]
MDILSIRAIEGRNIYCRRPVIVLSLRLGQYNECFTDQIEDFNVRLLKQLPGLSEHYCSKGRPGGLVERLYEGTLLGHVIEHVALELQYQTGSDVSYGKTRFQAEPDVYDVIYEYQVKEVGLLAGKMAFGLVKSILEDNSWNLEDNLAELTKTMAKFALGPSTKAIIDACQKRNIPVMRLDSGSFLQLGYGSKQKRVQATITENTSCLAVDIAGDKMLTKKLLGEAGIPIPQGCITENLEEALLEAKSFGRAVVIKPCNGNQGKGVVLNLQTPQEITAAFQVAKNYSNQILVEEHITGRHYRVLVVNGKIAAVAERKPTYVIGDGQHTIKELINIINQDPARGIGHEKPLTKISIDPELILVLTKQGLSLDYIPEEGEKVNLRENANLSTGGVAIDVTDSIHKHNAELVLRAVDIIGLDVAGVDLVTPDISRPMDQDGGAIIEINAAPGIRMHHYPVEGQPRNAGQAIVDYLFPNPGDNGRIPIAVITGTNGKTTTTRLLAFMGKKSGHIVGYTTTSGVFIGENCIIEGDTTGPKSAQAVLKDKRVTLGVLETARGGILRGGLGYDLADIAVVTNISEDHLGQDGINTLEELADVKALVLEALPKTGTAVLNADDPLVTAMAKKTEAQIIYFSRSSDNITVRRHLGAGGKAVFIKNKSVILAEGTTTIKLIDVSNIALTKGGMVSYNVENALAAICAGIGLGFELQVIINSLKEFGLQAHHNPGRLEVYEINDVTIVLDYGHNPAGYEEVFAWIKTLQCSKIHGVIGVPGDRWDETIKKAGSIAAKHCHYLYVKEDADLRGRKPGEVAELLLEGALNEGKEPLHYFIKYQELEAFKMALENSEPGDLVVVFYEKLEPILEYLKDWSGKANVKPTTKVAVAE